MNDSMSLYNAMQTFRAAIMSDGSLTLNGKNAYFHISLADNKSSLVQRELIPIEDLLKFLQRFVIGVLVPLGIKPSNGYPKIVPHITKSKDGKWLPGVMLETWNSELSTKLYYEYYPEGKKIIPGSFILTSIFLAWFFMFDGSSAWHQSGGPGVQIHLCTEGFNSHSIVLFEKQLHEFGINTGRGHVPVVEDGAGIIITVLQDSVDRFMKIIDPHVIPPYRYKIKYRRSCPLELAEKYRKNHREYCDKNRGRINEYTRECRSRGKEKRTQVDFDNLKARLCRAGQ